MFKLYDAIVVSDETDRTFSGAVRVAIIGITDGIEDDFQPWALPSVNYMMAVPTKGSYVKVYFENDDIHQPSYIHVSPQKTYLPQEFIDNYPNTAVSNLGSDLFQMTHDRIQKRTIIDHDSDSSLTWDSFGKITHESEKGYENTGIGAKNNNGKKVQPVLTEGTINVFTCMPFSGGSEYLSVTHISKSTVTGSLEKQEKLNEQTRITDSNGIDSPVTRPLLDDEVEYIQANNIISTSDRVVKYVLIGSTGNVNFEDSMNYIMDSSLSAHYIIGREIDEIIQMIDIDKIGTFGNKSSWNKESNLNKVSVTILLCGIPTQDYSLSQYENIKKIIQNTKNKYGNNIEVITSYETDPISGSLFGTLFDKGKI